MLKTVAMLCDYATVADGKLYVSGAGVGIVNTAVAEPPLGVNLALAVVVTIPWNSTNQPHVMTVELVSDQGSVGPCERIPIGDMLPPNHDPSDMGKLVAHFNAGRSPTMEPGEDSLMPVAVPLYGLALPRPGGYFFSICVDGEEADRVSFRVQVVNPMLLGRWS